MAALVFSQIPDAHIPASIAANQFSLIRVYHNIVDRTAMVVIALHSSSFRVPNLHRAIFRARDHPFRIAVKANPRDVIRVTLERQDGCGIGAFAVVQLDCEMPRRGDISFIG